MTKKVILITTILLFIIAIFSNTVLGYTEEEIKEIKQTTEQLLQYNQNSKEKLENLNTVKNKLSEVILLEENKDNKTELQKLKLDVTKSILNIEMQSIQNNMDNATLEGGYQSPVFGSALNGTVLTEYKNTEKTPTRISFKGIAEGVDTSLANDPSLYCIEKGTSLPSVLKSTIDGKDATLVVKDKNGNVTYSNYIDKVYAPGEIVEGSGHYDDSQKLDLTGANLNRFGKHGIESDYYYEFENSRTIAKFTGYSSPLKAGESYIYAQSSDNNGGTYPDVCQQASWIYNGQLNNVVPTNPTQTNAEDMDVEEADAALASVNAQQLAGEAMKFEELATSWASNKPTVTGDATKSTVIFNQSENSFYVGPITLQYERETYPVANGARSVIEEMERTALKNHVAGLVEYSGINDIVCYDENGKVLTGTSIEILNRLTRQQGDNSYMFPYPNEEFYIKIPFTGNENSTKFAKMTVEIFYLTAEGTATTLTGNYTEQTYGGIAVPEICTCTVGVCQHGNTIAHDSCQPIYCRDCYLSGYLFRVGTPHAKGLTHYIVAIGSEQKHAQPLKQTKGAKVSINYDKIDIEINKDLVMEISGIVWEDERSEKASDNNGIIDSTEKGMEGVKVIVYLDGAEIKNTYTDKDGKYKFEKLKIGNYIIGFEYDGQTYIPTRLLAIRDASGNITEGDLEAYRRNPTADAYRINSKATETDADRQNFNNKFNEITKDTAIGTNNARNTLQYTSANRISTLVTKNNNQILDLYKILAKTVELQFQSVTVDNVNLGLVKRPRADFALNMDVYQSHVRVKNVYQTFTYNERKLNNITDFEAAITKRIGEAYGTPVEYNQQINKADYDWEWDESLGAIYPDKYTSELQVYIDYKIVIRNQSERASGKITELVNYYDAELIYGASTPVSNISSWIVLGQLTTESGANRKEVVWQNQSKYGTTQTYNGYSTMYTNSLADMELQPGESVELHIVYAVKKDSKIIMDTEDVGKKNIVEINGYQTFLNNKIEGKIDNDSNPGNANPDRNIEFEDDTDMAPYFKLVFEHGVGNVIEGNVWEDFRTETLDNNQLIGNGIREKDSGEPDIGGVIVELVEVYSNEDIEIEKTVKTTTTAYSGTGTVSDGGYRFEQIPSGTYRVKFTYGADSQLQNNLKYNAQDYQATVINGKVEQSNSSNIELVFVIDVSGSMSGSSLQNVKQALVGENGLIKELTETMPDVQMGLVQFETSASKLCDLTNNYEALEQAINSMSAGGATNISGGIDIAREMFTNNSDKKKIMVLLTDGYPCAGRDTKTALIEAADNYGIYPISILVGIDSYVQGIFGTPEDPIRGSVYSINAGDIVTVFMNDIYSDIEEYTTMTENRSYASDTTTLNAINNEAIATQTRLSTISNFRNLINENGKILHVKDIENIHDEAERQAAITTLANNTYVSAITNKLRVSSRNRNGSYIRQVNLGLTERPKVELQLEEKIVGIKLTLSNGTILIDTENGLNNYVQGLNKADKGLPVSISLDPELQQGATIEIKYKMTVTNVGDVDTLESYFAHYEQGTNELNAMLSTYTDEDKALLSSYFSNSETVEKGLQSIVPTKPTTIYNYINSNMTFRQENNPYWEVVTDKSILSEYVGNSINQDTTIIKLKDSFNKYLYPTSAKVAKEQTYLESYLTLSKVLSPQNDNDTLVYKNSIEIVQRQNAVGRRDYGALPGNYEPNSTPVEYDADKVQEIKVIPPFGEQRIYYILTASVVAVLIAGILVAKKVLKKKQ